MRGRYVWLPKWEDTNESFGHSNAHTMEIPKASISERKSCCTVCFHLNPQYLPEGNSVRIRHSKLQESVKSGCQFCLLIHNTLSYYLRYGEAESFTPEVVFEVRIQPGDPILLARYFSTPYFPSIMLYAPPGMLHFLSLVSPGEDISHVSHLLIIKGIERAWDTLASVQEVSTSYRSEECLTLTKKWITDCVNFHEDCNQNSLSRLPRRVIDIGSDITDMRLLEEDGLYGQYAALSHCWGKKRAFETTMSTLSCRKQKLEWTLMPALFRDAITVTRDLGLRYLWIDSLCIIQDDNQDWEIESAKMGTIYESAHIVVAASSSPDPDHSFLDPRRTMFADHLELSYQREDGRECVVKARPVVELNASIDPLDRRAWAFQEQRRAVRLLRYSTTELKWDCRTKSGCECESVHLKGLDLDIIFGKYCVSDINHSPVTDFGSWQTMLKSYTERRLTRQSDRLPALSGIAAAVQKRTSSCYLAGLWKDNLVSDLQWRLSPTLRDDAGPTFSSGTFQFRLLRMMSNYRAPTFSWASIDSVTKNERSSLYDDSEIDAVVLDAECTLKGANPFGEVLDGFIILEAPMVQADVTVDYEDDGSGLNDMGMFELTRDGMKTYMTADLPLVECQVWPEPGVRERSMKRASVGDNVESVTGPIFCASLYRNGDGRHFALVLGRSPRISGAYERLGIMDFNHVTSNYDGEWVKLAGEAWFANAERCVVKIV
jgi:hypothetical protein